QFDLADASTPARRGKVGLGAQMDSAAANLPVVVAFDDVRWYVKHGVMALTLSTSSTSSGPLRGVRVQELRFTNDCRAAFPADRYGYGLLHISASVEDLEISNCHFNTPNLSGIGHGPNNFSNDLRVLRNHFARVGEHGLYIAGGTTNTLIA